MLFILLEKFFVFTVPVKRVFESQDAINTQELIKIADKKMYLQKRDK